MGVDNFLFQKHGIVAADESLMKTQVQRHHFLQVDRRKQMLQVIDIIFHPPFIIFG